MPARLLLKPSNATLDNTKNVSFDITDISYSDSFRVRIENATNVNDVIILSSSCGEIVNNIIYINQSCSSLEGKIDLNIPETEDSAVISIYANIEIKENDKWKALDIAAFSFQINQSTDNIPDIVNVYPPFIGISEKTNIEIISDPNSIINIIINSCRFSIKTDENGKGTRSILGSDILLQNSNISAIRKLPVRLSKVINGLETTFNTGIYIHIVPESMKVLQATNDPSSPNCAIFDPEPGPGLQLQSADDFCFEGSVVGNLSVFDNQSGYINSKVGFCTEVRSILDDKDDSCRIYNSLSSDLLPNGSAIVAFASQSNDASDPYKVPVLASRVYIASLPTSLKYRGNPVRNGTILKPPAFYHSIYPESVFADEIFGVEFRIEGGSVFEIQVRSTDGSGSEIEEKLTVAINNDSRCQEVGISALNLTDRIDVYGDNRFSIVVNVYPSNLGDTPRSVFRASLNTNQTLEIITSEDITSDVGDDILFLIPTLGSQSYKIESKSLPDTIRIFIPQGVNNTFGPTVEENQYCQKFIIIDSSSQAEFDGLTSVNPLPYILDSQQREVPSVNPVIATRKDYVNNHMYVYVVTQAPVNNIYQLFFYGFRLGDLPETSGDWIQLTFDGENRNPSVSCDHAGNLHICWESDRDGPSQIYYGVLGHGSRSLVNQVLMSALDKEAEGLSNRSLLSVGDPVAIQEVGDWYRLIGQSGAVSIVGSNKVAVQGNVKNDAAIALYPLNTDENGDEITGYWSQISYQISFDLSINGIADKQLSDRDIDNLFTEWKSQFIAIGNNRYSNNSNIYTLDRYDYYFDKIIPICGSYKLDGMSEIIASGDTLTLDGGQRVSGFSDETGSQYVSIDEVLKLSHGSNVRHFVLGILPEKVRFKATNIDSFFRHCERNNVDVGSCDTYNSYIEKVYYTGRASLCLLIATSEDEATGKVSYKKFYIARKSEKLIDVTKDVSKNIKIAVHYSKNTSDNIESRLKRDRHASEQDYRFNGDIVVLLDNESHLSHSFLADFSDHYRQFEIGLGLPFGGQYLTHEILPYNANEYDNISVRMVFENIAIGPHSVHPIQRLSRCSIYDRNTRQMVVSSITPTSIIENGDFEIAAVSPGTFMALSGSDNSISNWTIIGGVNYVGELIPASRNQRCIWLSYAPEIAKSDFAEGSESWQVIIPHTGDPYGGVAGSTQSVIHDVHTDYDDGYIYIEDTTTGILYWLAPSKFNGNHSEVYGGILHFRLKASEVSSSSVVNNDVYIEGNNGNILAINIDAPVAGEWTDYSIAMRSGFGWKIATYSGNNITSSFSNATESQIIAVLSSINRLLIRSDFDEGGSNSLQYLDSVAFIQESGIQQICETTSGKNYTVRFDLSAIPVRDAYGTIKKIRVVAGSVSKLFEFDISDNILSSEDQLNQNAVMNWATREFTFTATSNETTISFLNETGLSYYTCCVDNVGVFLTSDLVDETDSYKTSEELHITDDEFYLNYSLTSTNGLSQIPVTLPADEGNKTCNITIDDLDKLHIVWESNRNGFWDVYYSGSRIRSRPFRFETKITNSISNALRPSIGVDSKGRRLVAWHDNRNGAFQIYSAVNKTIDPQWIDQCKIDEANENVRQINPDLDPYDPYSISSEVLGCQVSFDFEAPITGVYHFVLSFYTDSSKTQLVKRKYSRDDIAGWRVNDIQMPYDGALLPGNESSFITYNISEEDDLTGKVLHVVIEYVTQNNEEVIDINRSEKVIVLDASPSLDLRPGIRENTNNVFAFVEYSGPSPIDISEQPLSYFLSESVANPTFIGMTFQGNLNKLPGAKQGNNINVTYVHWDPVGNVGSAGSLISNVVIKFKEPVIGIIWKDNDLESTDAYFAVPGATYTSAGDITRGIEWNPAHDRMILSEDRLTLTVQLFVLDENADGFRVITAPPSDIAGEIDFVFYCPFEQEPRCSVTTVYTNDLGVEQDVHFRFTAYANAEKDAVVLSSFTVLDGDGWIVDENEFPSDGITVQPGQSISVVYDPDILPFEMFDQQNNVSGKQALLCGVSYYVTVEAYINGGFKEIYNTSLLCPCTQTKNYHVHNDEDSSSWISSGQGKNDLRITLSDSIALNVKVKSTVNDIFYIVWQDFRYANNLSSPISSDFFFGIYDANKDEYYSSGQGDFDRRITNVALDNMTLYNGEILVDFFQNLVTSFHDGQHVFSKSCSLGCKYVPFNPDSVKPCMFTDGTFTNAYFEVGDLPDRDIEQFQKIKVHKDYVAFSTYKDINVPIAVVDDCFLTLDVIGVPGTYAYRLRNDNDDSWSEWLPIGPDLPDQPSDNEGTKAERDFFRAYFVGQDRFVAPWIASSGNGLKRICCEVLTYFGKTSMFCCEFMAIYNDLKYNIDFYFDENLTVPVPKYLSYPVATRNKTESPIDDVNLVSITEDLQNIENIYVKVSFVEPLRINRIDQMKQLNRFSHLGDMTIDILQQGINDYKDIPLTKVSDGIYRASFKVEPHDGVVNADGLATVIVNIPGRCKNITDTDIAKRIESSLYTTSLEQNVSMFNDLALFRENYNEEDLRSSFGDPNYYQVRSFGVDRTSQDTILATPGWPGGSNDTIPSGNDNPSSGGGNGGDGGGSNDSPGGDNPSPGGSSNPVQ